MRRQHRSAKRIRGREGEREKEREERGKEEKGVATWRPKCQESSEQPLCLVFTYLLL